MAEEFFNGGGHLNASGGKLQCTMEEAVEVVKRAVLYYEDTLK
jgi:phosphoesterase RecJ-like protein